MNDVDLLCLDAGNTVIFLDHARLAAVLRDATGLDVDARTLIAGEGEAKRRAETGELFDAGTWAFRGRPGAPSWGKLIATIVTAAGLAPEKVPALLDAAWPLHEAKNFWCKVPEGLIAALDAIRARGKKTAIISNSEGMLDRLFRDLGIRESFDLIVDSGVVGIEKPDPRIFRIALDHFGVAPERAFHLGDVFATDVLGARAAGIRCALIDPHAHYAGKHADVPRVSSVADFARSLVD